MRTALFWVISQRVVAISSDVSEQHIGPEMSRNYQYSLRNIPEEHRSIQVLFETKFAVINREFLSICAEKANSVLYCLFFFGFKQIEMC
jgi:hypothetical protein